MDGRANEKKQTSGQQAEETGQKFGVTKIPPAELQSYFSPEKYVIPNFMMNVCKNLLSFLCFFVLSFKLLPLGSLPWPWTFYKVNT